MIEEDPVSGLRGKHIGPPEELLALGRNGVNVRVQSLGYL